MKTGLKLLLTILIGIIIIPVCWILLGFIVSFAGIAITHPILLPAAIIAIAIIVGPFVLIFKLLDK